MFSDFFKIVFDSVFVIQVLVISISLVVLFIKPPFTTKKILHLIGVVIALSILAVFLNAVFFYLFTFARPLASMSYTVSYALLFIIYYLFVKEKKKNKWVMLISFLSIEVVTTEFASLLMRYFEIQFLNRFEWISIVSYLLILLVAILMRLKNLTKFSQIPVSISLLVSFSSVISIVITRYYTIYNNIQNNHSVTILSVIIFLALYLLNITTYLLSYGACMERQAFVELVAENEFLDSNKEMMRISLQTYNDIRSIKHDIKNQFGIMNILLKEKKYDELEQYFQDLSNTMAFSIYRIDCGNEKFNAVLNMEISKARAYNIPVSTNLIVPSKLPFRSADLCSILSNAIDNAIEYLHKNKLEDKPIGIDVFTKGEFLYIGISNEVIGIEDSENPDLTTEKEDGRLHGIGHKIIHRLAKKYNGYANFTISNHQFITEVMLDLKYVEGNKK